MESLQLQDQAVIFWGMVLDLISYNIFYQWLIPWEKNIHSHSKCNLVGEWKLKRGSHIPCDQIRIKMTRKIGEVVRSKENE